MLKPLEKVDKPNSVALNEPNILPLTKIVYGNKGITNNYNMYDNVAMAGQRPSVYINTNDTPPGANIRYMRDEVLDMSQRRFCELCEPPINHTTLQRVEAGGAYRKDTLETIARTLAKLLNSSITVSDLFLPDDIKLYAVLDDNAKSVIKQNIQWAAKTSHKGMGSKNIE